MRDTPITKRFVIVLVILLSTGCRINYDPLDDRAPQLLSVEVNDSPAGLRQQVTFLLTFSEAVEGVSVADLEIHAVAQLSCAFSCAAQTPQGAAILSVEADDASHYRVTVDRGQNDGYLTVLLAPDASIHDRQKNPIHRASAQAAVEYFYAGRFSPPRPISTVRLSSIESLAVGDVDGDGDADVVVGSSNDYSIRYFEQDGGLVLHDQPLATGAIPTSLPPLLTGGGGSLAPLLWLNSAPATSVVGDWARGNLYLARSDDDARASPAFDARSPEPCTAMTSADLDGDGETDAVCLNAAGRLAYLSRDETYRWFNATTIDAAVPGATSAAMAAGDLDGDGRPEIIVGLAAGSGGLGYYEAGADGSFRWNVIEPSLPIYELAVGDLDDNGALDIVARGADTPDLWWFANEDGVFERRTLSSSYTGSGTPVLLRSADLDGDGRSDVVVLYPDEGLERFISNTDGTFGATFDTTDISALETLELADLDGDDDTDLIGLDRDTGSLVLYRNDGSGTSFAVEMLHSGRAERGAVRDASDMDGDGDADLITARGDGLWLAESSGDGLFEFRKVSPAIDVDDARFCNLDRDGNADIIVRTGDSLQTLVSAGATSFTSSALTPGISAIWAFSCADYDGDGDDDYLVENESQHVFHRNDGAGAVETTLALHDQRTSPARTGDFDGDGQQELVASGGSPASFFVLRWNGSGFDRTDLPVDCSSGWLAYDTGDLDSDGDVDIMAGVWSCAGVSTQGYRNNGGLSFSADIALPAAHGNARFSAVDLDGDGTNDLLHSSNANRLSWYRLSAGASQIGEQHLLFDQFPSEVFPVDVDGDGDIDIVTNGDPIYSDRIFHDAIWFENFTED